VEDRGIEAIVGGAVEIDELEEEVCPGPCEVE